MKSVNLLAILSAIGFVAVASFDNVHAWPLIFPLVGGIAVMFANRSNAGQEGYSNVFKSALLASVITMILSFLSIWFLAKESISKALEDAGYPLTGNTLSSVAIISIVLGIIFLISYLLGTAVGALFTKRKHD